MTWPACHSLYRFDDLDPKAFCRHPKVRTNGQRVSRIHCETCGYRTASPPEWFHGIPGDTQSLVKRPQMQLVVARYREDASWLERFPGLDVLVYDKGDPQSAHSLPNVGRESHTYLHHIITHYDRLAEMTVFLQGHPHDHCPRLEERIWTLTEDVGFQDLSERILVEDGDGLPIHRGLPLADRFQEIFGQSPPKYFACYGGACFAVTRDVIRSRPREFYERILQRVVSEPIGPYWIERLWRRVFRPPANRQTGIVTASDAPFFGELQFLLHSLRPYREIPLLIYDLGLTPEQRAWCLDQRPVRFAPIPQTVVAESAIRRLHHWQAWIKPFLLFSAPFERMLWIDADCNVLGNPHEAFDIIDHQPLLVRDGTEAVTENAPELYRHLPLDREQITGRSVNAGVVGLKKSRDEELLAAWMHGVQWILRNPHQARLSAWADQGIFRWALYKLGLTDRILDDLAWNHPAGVASDLIANAVRSGSSVLSECRWRYPRAKILHWLGDYKLSKQLEDQLEFLFLHGTHEPFDSRTNG